MVSVACCHHYSNMQHASRSGDVPRNGGLAGSPLWLASVRPCMCNTGRFTLRPSRGSCGSVGLAAEARARCRRFRLYAKNLSGLVSLSCESTINLWITNAALRSLVRSDIFSCYRVGSRRKPLTPLVLVIRRHRAGAPACSVGPVPGTTAGWTRRRCPGSPYRPAPARSQARRGRARRRGPRPVPPGVRAR